MVYIHGIGDRQMARLDQITIKMNRETHDWLVKEKQETGASIRYLMDKAVGLLKLKRIKSSPSRGKRGCGQP